jgi:hypothetical protein
VPTIDLPADELAAVTAAIRRAIENDRYPHAPRLDLLRAALARLEAAIQSDTVSNLKQKARRRPRPTRGQLIKNCRQGRPRLRSPDFKLGRPPPERKSHKLSP